MSNGKVKVTFTFDATSLYGKDTVTSDETTYRHGYFWVKCTQKTITVHIPFLTEDMVRHSVNKLVEKGIMKVGVFNDDKFDHTYWYTFTAYGNELLDDSRCFD